MKDKYWNVSINTDVFTIVLIRSLLISHGTHAGVAFAYDAHDGPVTSYYFVLRQEVRADERRLIDELHNIYGPDCLECVDNRKEYAGQMETLRGACRLTDLVLDNGKDIELLLVKKDIHDKLSTLDALEVKPLPSTVDKVVRFVRGEPRPVDFGYVHDDERPLVSTMKPNGLHRCEDDFVDDERAILSGCDPIGGVGQVPRNKVDVARIASAAVSFLTRATKETQTETTSASVGDGGQAAILLRDLKNVAVQTDVSHPVLIVSPRAVRDSQVVSKPAKRYVRQS